MTEKHSQYSIGDEVRIVAGPLLGLEGIVSSHREDNPARINMSIDLLGHEASVEIDTDLLELIKSAQAHIKEELKIAVRPVSSKLIYDLAQDPDKLHELSSRKFEELVAELLSDMGYD
ncbi:MAG: hypothetical protein HQ580_11175, partial [Planctomycetes bacterium]|nr:hypothetical protein [Planctomycetota bacterium]